MGLARNCIRLLLKEHKARPFSGAVMQLGRQAIYAPLRDVSEWAGLHGVQLRTDVPVAYSPRPDLREQGFIDDVTLFRALGFETVHSCDVSDFEGATHTVDLNRPLPEALHAKYDVVFDGGTIEHVFDQANVLRCVTSMLKVGGRVIHASPSTNHMDHGFYMYSPTLFCEYYLANHFRIEGCYLFAYDVRDGSGLVDVYEYRPDELPEGISRFADKSWLIFFIATKTEASRGDAIPMQGCYVSQWKDMRAKDHRAGLAAQRPATPPARRPIPMRERAYELARSVGRRLLSLPPPPDPKNGLTFVGRY